MTTLLLCIIYIAFISMGLPDGLLGAAWPSVYTDLNVPVSWAGIVTILIAAGTVFSSLLSDRLLRKFGTGIVAVACTLLTVLALFGFSTAKSFITLCLWAFPYGMGSGSIDAALNNYVALHGKSRHMSWIHFFWGIGATAGPYLMGALLTAGINWTGGYRMVGCIQGGIALLLLVTLPMWKKDRASQSASEDQPTILSKRQALSLPGAKAILVAFFCYCALEGTAGLWASSYMTFCRGISAQTAAKWTSLFYLGITLGRFACGFISDRIGDRNMVRIGQGMMVLGTVLLLLPFGDVICFSGLLLVGLGCAPVYPCLLHETPDNFGAQNSQVLMGLQMACAYTGSTLMPPLFGWIAEYTGHALFPMYLLILAVLMFVMAEQLNAAQRRKKA